MDAGVIIVYPCAKMEAGVVILFSCGKRKLVQ